jgi:hypothetical protein
MSEEQEAYDAGSGAMGNKLKAGHSNSKGMSAEEITVEDDLSIPGHVSAKRAAKILGVTPNRVYDFARQGRLAFKRVSHMLMISIESLEEFRAKPTGRTRQKPPDWRTYKGGGELQATAMTVPIKAGKKALLYKRLADFKRQQLHTFRGSIARYVLQSRKDENMVEIWLVWKDTELPDEMTRQRELQELREALGDALEWGKASVGEFDGIIYT